MGIFVSLTLFAIAHANPLTPLQRDLQSILVQAHLPPEAIALNIGPSNIENTVQFVCGTRPHLDVKAAKDEVVSTFYYGLHKLGFLFPHPRWQISPTSNDLASHCGKMWTWRPSLRRRGFHLHTEHPNEWVDGFFGEDPSIAQDTIKWLARNFQNTVQVQMIRFDEKKLALNWKPLIALAHDFGIRFGLVVSFSEQQQKSRSLIPLFNAVTGINDIASLKTSLNDLSQEFDYDFLVTQFGTTEFTPTPFARTLKWINTACQAVSQSGKEFFAVAHVSTGQTDPRWGNFNFLPQYSSSCVGIQAHTVLFYGLNDAYTPVYGRKNFSDMKTFALNENKKRETWFYPETSYFIGMDIDMPLLLLDYLRARSEDYLWTVQNGLPGHMTFTTGQEMGYWLMDWTVALQADEEYLGDPLAGLRLLGEDSKIWAQQISFQNNFVTNKQLVQVLSTSNLLDELFPDKMIHQRTLLSRLENNPQETQREVDLLGEALAAQVPTSTIRNDELKHLLDLFYVRLAHARLLRLALLHSADRHQWVKKAEDERKKAARLIKSVHDNQRYPQSLVFARRSNPTSYDYGYGWPGEQLYFWQREERMIRRQNYDPFFMNLYDIFKLLF